MSENKIAVPVEITEFAKGLDASVMQVLGSKDLVGFEKAYTVSSAVKQLKEALTPAYMAPIMLLQNNRLGFKTDRSDGYALDVVKNCLIEAVMMGVQPVGNQFNIIAGNCYITKEGFKYLLDGLQGFEYHLIPMLPRIKDGSAACVMQITWKFEGQGEQVKEIDFAIRVNNGMGADAVIGKATRKARAWLYNRVMNVEIGDGDVDDGKTIHLKESPEDKEKNHMRELLAKCETLEKLDLFLKDNPEINADLVAERREQIMENTSVE